MFKTVAVVTNTSKKEACKQTPKVIAMLEEKSITVKVAHEVATELKCGGLSCSTTDLVDNTDLIITLGGDGTVLRAVSYLQGRDVPILAINYGKFGFLQEIEPENLYEDLERAINGDYYLEKRSLLEVKFNDSRYLVLNDLVATHDGFRIMEVETYINGTFFYKYAADGLAIATATGAAAYSFSAGGPFVNPEVPVTVLTPLNPHSLLNRSIVLGPEDIINIKVASIDGNLKLSADGLSVHHDTPIDVQVKGAKETVSLVRVRESDFFGFLRKKLVALCGVNGAD